MLSAIFAAAILTIVLVVSVRHMPNWFKAMLLKVPAWLQAGILHFGYAGWIGGVAGHMMGAPLAIMWFMVWKLWLKDDLAKATMADSVSRKDLIKGIVNHIKGWFSQIDVIGSEIKDAVAVAA